MRNFKLLTLIIFYSVQIIELYFYRTFSFTGKRLFQQIIKNLRTVEYDCGLSLEECNLILASYLRKPSKSKSQQEIMEKEGYLGLYDYDSKKIFISKDIAKDSEIWHITRMHESLHWAFDNEDESYDIIETIFTKLLTQDRLMLLVCTVYGVRQVAIQMDDKQLTLSVLTEEFWCDFGAMYYSLIRSSLT